MCSPARFIRRLFAAAVALVVVAQTEAQLAKTSPFMPPAGAAAATPSAAAPLEFRGWIQTGEGILYRLRDPAKKVDTWVKLNERDGTLDVTAKKHDPEKNTLTIDYQGKSLTLAVREAKIVSSGSAAHPMPMPAPVAAASNVSPAVIQSVVPNPTPADEQRRLEAVAAEVARRRALREQAAQQSPPAGANPAMPRAGAAPMPGQAVPSAAMPQRGFNVQGTKSGPVPQPR